MGDAVIIIDARHRVIEFNTEAERVFGYEKTEVLGKSVNVLLPEGHRHGHDSNIAAFATEPGDRRLMRERAEVHGQRKDGAQFDAEISIAKIASGGELQFMAVVRDVSVGKRVERVLHETTRHLKQAQQLAQLGSIEIDIQTGAVIWSAEMYGLLGCDPHAPPLSRESLMAMVHPDDRALILRRFGEAAANRTASISADLRITRADGIERIFQGVSEFTWGENGQLLRLVAALQDVTEERVAAEGVRLSKERLKRAQQLTNLGSWEWKPRANQMLWSDQLYRLLGLEPSSIVASFENFARLRHPDHPLRNRASGLDPLAQAAANPGQPIEPYEFRFRRADGAERWALSRLLAILGPDGEVTSVEGTIQDITEQKEASEQLRQSEQLLNRAQELANLGSWQHNHVTGEFTWSRSLFAILGLDPEVHRPSHETLISTAHPDERPSLLDRVHTPVSDRRKTASYDNRIIRGDGVERTLHSTIEYDWDADGRLLRTIGISQDVTEQRAAAERLRQSEQLLNRAQELADLGSWEHNEVTGAISWSRNFFVLLGLDPEMHRPSNELFWSLVQPDELQASQAQYREALSNRQRTATYNTRIRRSDGVERTLHNRVEYYWTSAGALERVTGISQDITEQLADAERLLQSEQSLANAQRIAHIGNWQWNFETHMAAWSDEAYRIYGLEASEIAPNTSAVQALVHPDDLDRVEAEVAAALRRERPYDVQYRIVRPSGEIRVVHELGEVTFAADGHPVQMNGTVQDVTEMNRVADKLQRSERMLADAERISRTGSWEADLITGEAQWSSGLYALLGFDRTIPAPDFPLFLSAIHPDDRPRMTQLVEAALRGDDRHSSTDYRTVTPDGTVRIIFTETRFIRDQTQRLVHLIGTNQDVTEERAAARDLQEALTAAQEGNRAKSEFLANMSHELRTPLNAIIGFSELLANERLAPSLSARDREYAGDIHDSGQHLLEIITDILDFSRIEAGRTDVGDDLIDTRSLLGWAVKLLGEKARAKNLRLVVEVAPDAASFRGDLRLLRQALLNILSNAIKFTVVGGIRLTATQVSNGALAISVTDTGIGMRPEDIPVALTPFLQLESSLQRNYEGIGLGLPLAKRFVELHGGTLTIASEPQKGTAIIIELPRQPGGLSDAHV